MEGIKGLGSYGELRFMSECILKRLTVHAPTEVKGYDCIVEYKGIYTKVQVKTTKYNGKRPRYDWNVRNKSEESEVYVFHVAGTDIFYMVPSATVKKMRTNFHIPHNNAQHLDDWNIFKTPK